MDQAEVQGPRKLTVYLSEEADAGLKRLAEELDRSQTWIGNKAIVYALLRVFPGEDGGFDSVSAEELGLR